MKIVTILSIVCIFSFTYSTISSAQTNGWTIITSAQDTLQSCTIFALVGDMVYLSCSSSVIHIPVDSLKILVKRNESHFWSGAKYGTLAGTALGIIVGWASYQRPTGWYTFDIGEPGAAMGGAILGAFTGFTIGGIVGAVFVGDEKYDLSQEPTEEKIKILRDIRRENR